MKIDVLVEDPRRKTDICISIVIPQTDSCATTPNSVCHVPLNPDYSPLLNISIASFSSFKQSLDSTLHPLESRLGSELLHSTVGVQDIDDVGGGRGAARRCCCVVAVGQAFAAECHENVLL